MPSPSATRRSPRSCPRWPPAPRRDRRLDVRRLTGRHGSRRAVVPRPSGAARGDGAPRERQGTPGSPPPALLRGAVRGGGRGEPVRHPAGSHAADHRHRAGEGPRRRLAAHHRAAETEGREGAAARAAGETVTIFGTDISDHNAGLTIAQVKAAGLQFATARAMSFPFACYVLFHNYFPVRGQVTLLGQVIGDKKIAVPIDAEPDGGSN